METTYALDTNIIIRYLRKDSNVRSSLHDAVTRGCDLVIPKIVDYELRRGFRITSAPKKEEAYAELAYKGYCTLAEMDVHSWNQAEQVYTDLYQKRLTVGELDILIAAFCIENKCTLVTNNTKDFENIDGLQLEDWSVD